MRQALSLACAIAIVALAFAVVTVTAAQACIGDCDGSGEVEINELIVGVGISLGSNEVSQCRVLDDDANGNVSISELVSAVRAALDGCPPEPTATPSTLTTPTPTGPPIGGGLVAGPEFIVHEEHETTIDEEGEGLCHVSEPRVAMDASGRSTLSWEDDRCRRVRGRQVDATGQPLGPVFRLNTFRVIPYTIDMEVRGDDLFVLWSEEYEFDEFDQTFDGSGSTVIGQRFDLDGGSIGSEFQVNTTTYYDQYRPAIDSAEDESFVVVWVDAFTEKLFAQRYDREALALGTEFRIDQDSSCNSPDIAVAADGRFFVVWQMFVPEEVVTRIVGRQFDPDGLPAGPEFPISSMPGSDARIAAREGGGFVVTWNQGSTLAARLFGANAEPVGSELSIDEFNGPAFDRRAAIVAAPDGGFVVAWQDDLLSVQVQRFLRSGEATGPRVTASTGSAQDAPELATDDRGNFVVVWGEGDASANVPESAHGRVLGIPSD